MAIGAGIKVTLNGFFSAIYAWKYDLSVSDIYGAGDLWHDTWTGALEGLGGLGITKAGLWIIGKGAPFLFKCGPVQALLAYAKASTALNRAFAGIKTLWNDLDAAVTQGSEAAMKSSADALAQARAAISLLRERVNSLASLLGFKSVSTHIGGFGRECAADVAHLLVEHFGITGREAMIAALRNWVHGNDIKSMSMAIGELSRVTGLVAKGSTSWGAATTEGAYVVFTGRHVVFGKVSNNGSREIIDLSGEIGARILTGSETYFLKTAEAVRFGPPGF